MMKSLAMLLLAFAGALAPALQAQDLPARAGRVAHIEGRASLYQDPEAGWEKAYVNSPVTSENSVWTDERSRAELRVSGVAMRLDELTQLDFARIDDDEIDAFVARGSVAVRVRHLEASERMVFKTPAARVRIRGEGRYRIDVDDQRQETRVTVFAGEARIGTGDGRMRVTAGRSVLIFGSDPEFVEERARPDEFDRWVLARDQRWRDGRTRTYVSEYMTGYEDLDLYGEWQVEPDYGPLWFPSRVSATWAPYRYGHWSYVRPWGWTWIDEAPWGYAPFHYGRWVYVRNRWAWHPGERTARPVWAPALVGWVGGSSFNVRISSGAPVGWYPLSPWDRYEPWFNASPTYVNRVNIVVRGDRPTREDRRRWHEWTRERGTTVVDRSALVERRPIAQAAIPVTMDAIRQAQALNRPETSLPSRSDYVSRQRQRGQQAPAPSAPPTVGQQPVQPGAPATSQQPPGRSGVVRPDFGRRVEMEAPRPSANPVGRGPAPTAPAGREQREREVRDPVDREIRDAQPGGREGRQARERAEREQQQQQERAAREAAQQQQQQQQRQAQERAQREAQQQQERAAREAAQQQQQQQREGQGRAQREQERAQREQQQAQERAAREAAQQQQQQQQQQQRQAQERAQREAQQQQEKAAREAAQQQQQQQQQQQRQAQERAQREAQQQQEKAAREAAQQQQQQQQQQRQAQERAQREAQQQQEKAAREAAQQQQQQQQAQERAQREAQRQPRRDDRDKDKEKEKKEKEEKDKEEKEKGGGKPR